MTGAAAIALLAGAALAHDTGFPAYDDDPDPSTCLFWSLDPDDLVAYSDTNRLFNVDTSSECRADMTCTWALTQPVGQVDPESPTSARWTAPGNPPDDCDPDSTTLAATCAWKDTAPRTRYASISLHCTSEQFENLKSERAEGYSLSGGGCTSSHSAVVFLAPLLGLRSRKRRTP